MSELGRPAQAEAIREARRELREALWWLDEGKQAMVDHCVTQALDTLAAQAQIGAQTGGAA